MRNCHRKTIKSEGSTNNSKKWPQVLVMEHRTHSADVQYGRAMAPAQWPRVLLPHTWYIIRASSSGPCMGQKRVPFGDQQEWLQPAHCDLH